MIEFKEGDKVHVIDDSEGTGGGDVLFFRVGDVGVVGTVFVDIDDIDDICYEVNFNGQGNEAVLDDGIWVVAARALELVHDDDEQE